MFDYICTVCGAVFEEPRNDYSDYYGCPYCGGDCERTYPCESCAKPVPNSKYEYHRCNRCKSETLKKFLIFRDALSPGEMHFLEDKTDGMYWKDIREGQNG